MSKENLIQEIKEIYSFLTEKEPTPDDEIESRERLIEKFKIVKEQNIQPDQIIVIDDILKQLENWDTLELWFKEVKNLSAGIEKFVKFNLEKVDVQKIKIPTEIGLEGKEKASTVSNSTEIDINKVVSQITEQFKGEIGNLKDTIEKLQLELGKKEEKIKGIEQKSIVKEALTQEKPPKEVLSVKESKLQPPRIKIPQLKAASKSPKIKIQLEPKQHEDIEEITPEKEILEEIDIKEAIEENDAAINSTELKSVGQETTEELIKMLETPEKADASLKVPIKPTIKHKIKPKIKEELTEEVVSEFPFKTPEREPIKETKGLKEIKLTPLPSEKPTVLIPKPKNGSILTPIPIKKPEFSKKTKKISEDITETPKKPILTPIPTQKPEIMFENHEITSSKSELSISEEEEEEEEIEITTPIELKISPIISEKPKISPISVEEIDTESIKSSSTDLFNVFSSVGIKPSEKTSAYIESVEKTPLKDKKKKIDKKKNLEEIQEISKPFTPLPAKKATVVNKTEPETLATDKDTLYQDLIALEGRRYALEKAYKDLSKSFEEGKIDDYEFTNQSEGLKNNLDDISSKIAKIRATISTL